MPGWKTATAVKAAKAAMAGAALLWAAAGAAGAAVVSNTTVRTVPGSCTALATSLADPILFEIGTVPSGIDIRDVDISILYSHPNRNAAYISLIQPVTGGTGYRRIPLKPNTGPAVANLNATFSDEATQAVNTGTHADADPLTPVFNDRVRPSAALSAADGPSDADAATTPAGQGRPWFLEVCNTNATAGQLRRVDIDYAVAADVADLSLEIQNFDAPRVGQTFTIPVRVTNSGGRATSGVSVSVALGAGFNYLGVSGATRNGNGRFVLAGSLAAGETRDIAIQVTVAGSGAYTALAEVATSAVRDPDSGPGNGIAGEDDTANRTYVPGQTPPGQPPTLQCALGRPVNTLDWQQWVSGANAEFDWPSASLGPEGYTVNGVPVSVEFTGSTNRFIPRALAAGSTATPVSDAQFTGGGVFGEGVVMNVDFAGYGESVTLTFNYGSTAIGAGGIQIPIADVDLGTWTDRIVATATLGTKTVLPVYTPGTSNTVVDGGLTGTGGSANTEGLGNAWITFPSSVDTVTITYSNSAQARYQAITNPTAAEQALQTNPAPQVISIENLIYCDPEDPEITAQKVVETDGYFLPGETVTYRLQATSAAGANVGADAITLDDTLPGNLRFVSAVANGLGTTGAFDPALPAAQTDCAGAGNTVCRIRYVGGELAREQTGEVVITAVVK